MLPEITMLSSMADRDFSRALDKHVEWGMRFVDLKDGIFDRAITDLSVEEATIAADLIKQRGLSVYCLSTSIGDGDIEEGEKAFRQRFEPAIERILPVASIMEPTLVRLVIAKSSRLDGVENAISYVLDRHPWVVAFYQDAISAIRNFGFPVTLENETRGCLVSNPREALDLFAAIGLGTLSFWSPTWTATRIKTFRRHFPHRHSPHRHSPLF